MLRCSGATTFLLDVVLGVFAVILLGAYLSFVLGRHFTLSSTAGSSSSVESYFTQDKGASSV